MKKKPERYVASGKPRSVYMTGRAMGLSKREARRMTKWVKAIVSSILSPEAP